MESMEPMERQEYDEDMEMCTNVCYLNDNSYLDNNAID